MDIHSRPGVHRFSRMERVIHGRPVGEVLPAELDLLGYRRVFVVTNRSMAATAALAGIEVLLGSRFAGRYDGVTAHAPRPCVIEGAQAAREAGADCLLAVGGGSVIDAAKVMLMCVRHGYTRAEELEPHANRREPDSGRVPANADRWLRVIAVPTTLSGAEFAAFSGATDPARGMKHAFGHPMTMPVSVILDPAMTLTAPASLLLATGIKAFDHAVERVTSSTATPFGDAVSLLAIRLLAQSLPRVLAEPAALDARADAQYGMFMSLAGSASGAAVNVSHAIGHVLGAHAHVPHGETSCVLMPAVLRWSASHTADRQRLIAQAMGEAASDAADAADAIAALVARLGLPQRLRDVGVRREDFAEIAAKTMHEALLRNSRRPVAGPQDIVPILELAW
jgi:maleylacetate reductase